MVRDASSPIQATAATAPVVAASAALDLELELLPDDFELPAIKVAAPTNSVPSPPAQVNVGDTTIRTKALALELVPDPLRAPPAPESAVAPQRNAVPSPTPAPARPVAPVAAAPNRAKPLPAKPQPPVPGASPTRKAALPEPPRRQATAAPGPAATKAPPAKPATAPAQVLPAAAAMQKPAAAAKGAQRPQSPSIDSTQTLRALVVPKDPAAPTEKLIVIQLVLSEREIAPESVPDLAIFNEYRLYSAVGHDQGKVMHALRLGFFSDEGPAEAVAGYLRSFFDAPAVIRISVEERERFATRRLAARKDSGDTGVHTAIELASAPSAPATSLADLRNQSQAPARSGHGRSRG